MHVLVYEQWKGGHYDNYLRLLVPALIDLATEVTVAIPQDSELEFGGLGSRVNVIRLPKADARIPILERHRIFAVFEKTVGSVLPDYVLVPSGDALSLFSMMRSKNINNLWFRTECILHCGYLKPKGFRQNTKEVLYKAMYRRLPWQRLNFVNGFYVEDARLQGEKWALNAQIVPDPVPVPRKLSHAQARSLLGIPTDGSYVGFLGSLDERNDIPRLLQAFRKARLMKNDRLLLAGRLAPSHRSLINSDYIDLVESGRLVVIDRFLSNVELSDGYQALDCTVIPRIGFPGLSSLLLKSVFADRPVLVTNEGWISEVTKRFRLGEVVRMQDSVAFAKAIEKRFLMGRSYVRSGDTQRLLRFHSEDNFVEHATFNFRRHLDPLAEAPKNNWKSVMHEVT